MCVYARVGLNEYEVRVWSMCCAYIGVSLCAGMCIFFLTDWQLNFVIAFEIKRMQAYMQMQV